jgi:hypothetical protein
MTRQTHWSRPRAHVSISGEVCAEKVENELQNVIIVRESRDHLAYALVQTECSRLQLGEACAEKVE